MEASLSNEFKDFFGFDTETDIMTTKEGLLRIGPEDFVPGTAFGIYAIVKNTQNKAVGVGRIVYAAFHPESIDLFRTGCRINLVRPLRMREGTNMVRNHLEDLILEPLSQRPERPLAFDSSATHPVGYGEIVYGVPYPLMYKNTLHKILPVPNYAIEFYDSYNTPFLIYNTCTKVPLRMSTGYVYPCMEGKPLSLAVHVVALASAFPEIDVSIKNTVDHINNDPTDHRVTNLQWLTMSENAAKSAQPERGGRPIAMLKRTQDEMVEVCRFKSQYEAARLIQKHLPDAGTVKSIASKISRNINQKPTHTPYNFCWRDVPMEIEGEEWRPLPAFLGIEVEGYQVSDKGRVSNLFGYLFRPVPNRHGKYTSVSLLIRRNSQETKRFYVHYLVFCTFNNCLPKGEVLHDDRAPLVNGYYRNYIEDLKDGTRSQNMNDHHDAKRQRLVETTTGPTDSEVYDVEDVMSDNASTLFNENTFHQQGWVFREAEEEARKKFANDKERLQIELDRIRSSKILKLRRDYPFQLNFYKASGGKGCMFTTKVFDGSETKGPCNQGYSANVKLLHMLYAYKKLIGGDINFAELLQELSTNPLEVRDLDNLFHIKASRGPNVINAMLKERGHLPQPGFFSQVVSGGDFNLAS